MDIIWNNILNIIIWIKFENFCKYFKSWSKMVIHMDEILFKIVVPNMYQYQGNQWEECIIISNVIYFD